MGYQGGNISPRLLPGRGAEQVIIYVGGYPQPLVSDGLVSASTHLVNVREALARTGEQVIHRLCLGNP